MFPAENGRDSADAARSKPSAAPLLGAIGAPGARKDWRDAVRVSGLAMSSAYDAVQELEAEGIVKAERFGLDERNIRSVTRLR